MAGADFSGIDQIIRNNWAQFRKPGVLAVRPGFKFTGGWITDKPAIVVTVDRKHDDIAAAERLPVQIGGIAVDVRQATPLDRIRHTDPVSYTALAAGRSEWAPPPFPFERAVGTAPQPSEPLVAALRSAANPAKQKLPYTAPAGISLAPVTDVMTITCHASPDAGWPNLRTFFEGVTARLTVGMYDFTSAHIMTTLEQSLSTAGAALEMTLDHPARDRTADQSDEETRRDIEQKLAAKAGIAWALTDRDPLVTRWIYPTSYHIKVAVRDGSAFWLSSGNWNNSNQPDIDPVQDPQGSSAVVNDSDRDWHVIIEHQGLAATFEAFLRHDFEVAAQWQAPAGTAIAAPVEAAAADAALLAATATPAQYFPALRIEGEQITVEPLLTPDNYAARMIELIKSATTKLYVQLQYIYVPKANDQFRALVEALKARINDGLDVRIIMSQYEVMGGSLEQLKQFGFDMSHVRIQKNLHNKGFIVDSGVVVVGSQNWSDAGTQTNRDATLIIHNDKIAEYFNTIFMHDWLNMAKQKVGL
jgi:hypothetical protein